MNMQPEDHAAWPSNLNMQHGQASTSSMYMNHRHGAYLVRKSANFLLVRQFRGPAEVGS
jgi:hypothetical protein